MAELTDEELLDQSEMQEEYDYLNPADADDYFTIQLYRAPDGRYFRYVVVSGMNSVFHGEIGTIEWLDSPDGWNEV